MNWNAFMSHATGDDWFVWQGSPGRFEGWVEIVAAHPSEVLVLPAAKVGLRGRGRAAPRQAGPRQAIGIPGARMS
jgi:hypothetical protein